MIGTDFQGLIATHDEANLEGFAMLKETNVTGSAFFPFIIRLIEAEKLGAAV